MFGITDLGVFVAGTIAIVLLPGPNSLYVLTVATRSGLRMGYAGAVGIFTGDTILMLLTIFGASSVLNAYPTVFHAIKWIGAAYLAWLGLKLIAGAYKGWQATRGDSGAVKTMVHSLKAVPEHTPKAVYRKALIVSLLNPKAIFFFISFFVQFVDPAYPNPGLTFALLGVIVQCVSLVYLSVLIAGGVKLAQTFAQRKRLSAVLNSVVGMMFIAFGARLAA
ncbi:MAG: leucine efflux protein LeuE [Burkholderiaceae bacterium]|jgi:leucine efflux protein|nr:leucine efflux protein LeuE [Burkholderiaceae bacterium]